MTAMITGRMVFTIIQTCMTPGGEFIPCIVREGMTGYCPTDWAWGKDLTIAEKLAQDRNDRMGISKKEAMGIVLRSMF